MNTADKARLVRMCVLGQLQADAFVSRAPNALLSRIPPKSNLQSAKTVAVVVL